MINMVFFVYLILFFCVIRENNTSDFTEECLNLPLVLCSSKGKSMLTAYNKVKSLIGWWSFDDKFAHDRSGNNLDGNPVPEVGPSYCTFSSYY